MTIQKRRITPSYLSSNEYSSEVFEVLSTWRQRLLGLLGTRRSSPSARSVAIVPCSSIHTFGMHYPLDVALIAKDGRVLGSWRGLRPCRLVSRFGAYIALERPSRLAPWPKKGSCIALTKIDACKTTHENKGDLP